MYFNKTKEETLSALGTAADGLDQAQVEEKKEEWGLNQLDETKGKTIFQVFLSPFPVPVYIYNLLFLAQLSPSKLFFKKIVLN